MKKSGQFLLNVGLLTVASFLMRSIQLSFSVFLSNRLGAKVMGTYHLLLSVYFFAVTVATSGISLSMTKLIAEEMATGSEGEVRSLLKKGISYAVFFSVMASVLLILVTPLLVKHVFHYTLSNLPFYILASGLPFLSVSSAMNGYFTARRKVYKSIFVQIPDQLFQIGLTLFLLYRLKPDNLSAICGVLVTGSFVGEVFSCLMMWVGYRMEKSFVQEKYSTRRQWKKLLSFSLPVAFSSYLRSGLSSLKQMLIPVRLRQSGVSNAVEQYGIVNGMIFPLLTFPSVVLSAFSAILVPEITEKFARKQMDSLRWIMARIFKITLLFAVGTGGILFLYATDLCQKIYRNPQIAYYLKLLAPLVVIMYLDDLVDAVLKGINQQVAVVRINILDSSVSLIVLWYLLPLYYVKGYLMMIYISEILNGTLSILRLMKHTDFSISLTRWILLPAGIIWICVLTAKILLPFSVTGGIFLSACLYVAVLYAAGIVSYRDFKISFR